MTTWTKELPKESGFYWWRRPEDEHVWEGALKEEVVFVEAQLRQFMPHALDYLTDPRGEFWPVRLLPPPERQETVTVTADMWNLADEALAKWKSSDQTPQDIRIYAASIPRVEVKIDPNQPNA